MNAVFRSLAAVCALILIPLHGAAKEPLTIFAAASLKDALDDAARGWAHPVVISYGGSGLIARQVAQGAPADLVVLANVVWMDWLEENGPALQDRRDLIANRLVLVGPAGAQPLEAVDGPAMMDRLAGGRLAMGNTSGVPAGIYARQWLENTGLWAELQTHLAETENVRAALALVARGEAPLGVVYASDAQADPGVDVVYAVPGSAHDPIIYPMAVPAGPSSAQAIEFAEYLSSEQGQDVFLRHGFALLVQAQ